MKMMLKWKDFVGPGWHYIVEDCVEKIESRGGFILQIKEKFGGLRIYSSGGDFDAIDTITREAERSAAITCEQCGGPGQLRNNLPWLKTLCDKCNMERK